MFECCLSRKMLCRPGPHPHSERRIKAPDRLSEEISRWKYRSGKSFSLSLVLAGDEARQPVAEGRGDQVCILRHPIQARMRSGCAAFLAMRNAADLTAPKREPNRFSWCQKDYLASPLTAL